METTLTPQCSACRWRPAGTPAELAGMSIEIAARYHDAAHNDRWTSCTGHLTFDAVAQIAQDDPPELGGTHLEIEVPIPPAQDEPPELLKKADDAMEDLTDEEIDNAVETMGTQPDTQAPLPSDLQYRHYVKAGLCWSCGWRYHVRLQDADLGVLEYDAVKDARNSHARDRHDCDNADLRLVVRRVVCLKEDS